MIWLVFSGIFIIRSFSQARVYDTVSGTEIIGTGSNLKKEVSAIRDTLAANDAVKHQDYETALKLISGDREEDYYNRATIQTLLAYQNAMQQSISWIESAKILIAQAQQNFDIAQNIAKSSTIRDAATKNGKTAASLSSVVDIKRCYAIGQSVMVSIQDIVAIIEKIKHTLDQEAIALKRRSGTIEKTCYTRLSAIIDTSKEQVGLLQMQMQKNDREYWSTFTEKIQDPKQCIDEPFENIMPSMIKGEQGLMEFDRQHTNSLEAIQSNDKKLMAALCDQTKNDSQINQDIESAVQDVLQKLEGDWWEKEDKQHQKATDHVQYKDFFDENEQKALEEVQKTNQWRIDTILNIRSKGNYEPEKYINDMFNQFYGNSGDFIDLHK